MARPESDAAESPLPPYWRCASFGENLELSWRVYFHAQDLIRTDPRRNLSIFHAHSLEFAYLVLALGEPPSQRLDRHIRRLLAAGEPALLPDEALQILYAYRHHTMQPGPRAERYHPGVSAPTMIQPIDAQEAPSPKRSHGTA
jgi:hypothetical protein